MKCFSSATALVLMLSSLLPATPAAAQAQGTLQNSQIEIVYGQPGNPSYRPMYDRLKKLQVLEELRQFLVPLRLPRKLTVQVDQCGATTRPYRPGGPATICYELVEQIERVAGKTEEDLRETVLVGTFVQAVFHEVALAVLDILQVPIWGRREDAADRLAGFIMLQFGEDVARQTVMGTGLFFEASGKTWTGSQFADVNSPEPQRYFNFLCMAYGGAPKVFESLAKAEGDAKPILPEDRAGRCKEEYAQVRKAFNLRIMPFVDPDLVIKVKALQWNNVGGGR
jgi:hypothetical protein